MTWTVAALRYAVGIKESETEYECPKYLKKKKIIAWLPFSLELKRRSK